MVGFGFHWRLIRLTALFGFLLGGLAAARPAAAGDLTFWTWRQEDKAAYTELFNDFTKQHPGIHVRIEAFPNENYQTILSTALAGGKGGDVLHVRAYGGLEQLARASYLVPLDPAQVPELANFSPAALAAESLRADHRVYAIPFAMQTLGLFINRDVFQHAGVKPPESWDEFLALCATLKGKSVIPLANGLSSAFMTEVFTNIFINPFLGPDFVKDIVDGHATFADPRYTTALGHLLQLRDFMPTGFSGIDYPTMQQLFVSGRAAMFAGGSFEIANFRHQNPKLDMDFIAPPAPKPGDPRPVSVYYDGGYAVNAKSPNQADALTLVRWMGTKGFGDRFTALLGNISPIKGVTVQDPLLAKVAELDNVSMPYMMLVYFRFESPTGSELLQNGVQQMMADKVTPQQLGEQITQGVARYYQPFQKH